MTAYKGTNVASAIRPFTDQDKYATAYASEIKGGHKSADTTALRNTISADRRELGMTVAVGDKIYRLITDPASDTTIDADWKDITASTDNIKYADGSTLEVKATSISELASKRYPTFVISPVDAGYDDIEIAIPFNANLTAITVSLPLNTVLTQDLVIGLEVNKSGAWANVQYATISSTSAKLSITTVLKTPEPLSIGDRLRINIVNCQAKLSTVIIMAETDMA